jgi:hypothetical protein
LTKVVLTTPASFVSDASAVAQETVNNAALTAAIENTLSRDGTGPNTMLADFDMNSKRILNLPVPLTGLEPVRLVDVSTAPGLVGALAKLNNLSDLTNVPQAKINLALVKGDVGLGNVDNTSDATKNAAVATLASKTLTAPVINSPTGIVKADVGLGNVDNISDVNKPVSTAQAAAIALKANIASPTFTGVPAAPTATVGTNTTQLATTAFVLANGTAAGSPSPPQGRLTLTAGVSVMLSSVAGATTVRYTPATGQFVPIWNGSSFIMTDILAELTQTTTDTTKSPAAASASLNYDVFVWNDAGTIRATRGPDWIVGGGSALLRGTSAGSSALTLNKVIFTNTNAITNGPGAGLGTYVGTIRTNASSTVDYIFGSAAAGGGAAVFNVWNLYNQVYVQTEVNDSTASWTQTNGAIRAANGSASNRISFVTGLAINGFNAAYQEAMNVPTASQGMFGVTLDSATTFSRLSQLNNTTASTIAVTNIVHGLFPAQIGSHFVQAVEQGVTGTITFQGPSFFQSLTAGLWQ